jgi:hypothetical protein
MPGKRKPVKPKPALKPWKKAKDVEWLKVSDELIGRGIVGSVFMGRLKLKGKKGVRVAVKYFKVPEGTPLKSKILEYKQAINNLRQAGVPLPKMAFIEHKGDIVLVSEAFVETRYSVMKELAPEKFKKTPKFYRSKMAKQYSLNFKEAKELFKIAAQTINAGYPFYGDFVEYMRGRLIPFDLDSLIRHKAEFDKDTARMINRSIRELRVMVNVKKEGKQKLYKILLDNLKPKYRKLARKRLQIYKDMDF